MEEAIIVVHYSVRAFATTTSPRTDWSGITSESEMNDLRKIGEANARIARRELSRGIEKHRKVAKYRNVLLVVENRARMESRSGNSGLGALGKRYDVIKVNCLTRMCRSGVRRAWTYLEKSGLSFV